MDMAVSYMLIEKITSILNNKKNKITKLLKNPILWIIIFFTITILELISFQSSAPENITISARDFFIPVHSIGDSEENINPNETSHDGEASSEPDNAETSSEKVDNVKNTSSPKKHISSEKESKTDSSSDAVQTTVSTGNASEASEPEIVYLSDDSEVYTSLSFDYIHTDLSCPVLTPDPSHEYVILTFKQAMKKKIIYCPECGNTILYTP